MCQQQGLILYGAGREEESMWICIQVTALRFECKNTKTFKQHHVEHLLFTLAH